MLHAPTNEKSGPGLAERRAVARLRVTSPIFVRLDDWNGGVVLNLSQNGLALSAAKNVPDAWFPAMRIQFPDAPDWIAVSAQVVWRSQSQKQAGVQFAGLTEDARRRINNWIVVETSLGDFIEEVEPLREGSGHQEEVAAQSSNHPIVVPEIRAKCTERPANNTSIFAGCEALAAELAKSPVEPVEQPGESAPVNVETQTVSGSPDRRARRRTRIVPLGYLQLGEGNGGIALNVSEDGLAITAGAVLGDDRLPCIRLLFPDTDDWIETSGQIVWRSESGKDAGVRFVCLTERARQQIRDWVHLQPLEGSVEGRIAGVIDEPKLALPNDATATAHRSFDAVAESAAPCAVVASVPENRAAFFVPAPVALPEADQPVTMSENCAPVPEESNEPPTRFMVVLPVDPRKVVALAALVAFVLLIPVLIAVRRDARFGITNSFANQREIQEHPDKNSPARPESLTPSSDLRLALSQKEMTSRQELPSEAPATARPETMRREAMNNPGATPSASARSLRNGFSAPEHAQGKSSEPERPVDEGARIADWKNSRPLEKAQAKADSGQAPPITQQENAIAASTIGVSNPPSDTLLAAIDRKEPPLPPPARLPMQSPANRLATVEVVADPYPSIQIPDARSSKKSSKRDNLQLGRLISRVAPVYPEEAKHQGIEGTVRVHAFIARDGTVERVEAVDGPSSLLPAALSAVRQWRFSQTLVSGRAVETEENIGFTFRLSK